MSRQGQDEVVAVPIREPFLVWLASPLRALTLTRCQSTVPSCPRPSQWKRIALLFESCSSVRAESANCFRRLSPGYVRFASVQAFGDKSKPIRTPLG